MAALIIIMASGGDGPRTLRLRGKRQRRIGGGVKEMKKCVGGIERQRGVKMAAAKRQWRRAAKISAAAIMKTAVKIMTNGGVAAAAKRQPMASENGEIMAAA
jgi:hypothetical protein